jgi:hypothetical protein
MKSSGLWVQFRGEGIEQATSDLGHVHASYSYDRDGRSTSR